MLLDGDLGADPTVIRKVVTVFKDGVGFDPERVVDAKVLTPLSPSPFGERGTSCAR